MVSNDIKGVAKLTTQEFGLYKSIKQHPNISQKNMLTHCLRDDSNVGSKDLEID